MKKFLAASIALVSVAANAQLMPITDGFLARAIAPAAIASATGVAKPVNAAIALVPPVRQSQLDASTIAAGEPANSIDRCSTVNARPRGISLTRFSSVSGMRCLRRRMAVPR